MRIGLHRPYIGPVMAQMGPIWNPLELLSDFIRFIKIVYGYIALPFGWLIGLHGPYIRPIMAHMGPIWNPLELVSDFIKFVKLEYGHTA